jgi:hypothetical protein
MLVNTVAGRSRTPEEIRAWISEAGCTRVKTTRLGDTVLVTGKK